MKRCKKIFLPLFGCLFFLAGNGQVITTIAGTGTFGFSGDGGPAINAETTVKGVSAGPGGIYIADASNGRIRKVAADGSISTYAGVGGGGYGGDGGAATTAILNDPVNLFADGAGNVFIADAGNQRIRKVDAAGNISTIAGNGTIGFGGDGGLAINASLERPYDVVADANGNIYFIDQANSRIRKINSSGIISTIAGNGVLGFGGDGGPATSAKLNSPTGLAIDAAGNIYFTDQVNQRVRKINTSGIISTVAGNGSAGFAGDGGPATSATLSSPIDVAVNAAGELFITDQNNHRIRKVDASGIISTFAGTGTPGFSGDGGPATAAQLSDPYGISIGADGNIYVGDAFNYRVRKIVPAIVPEISITALPASPICTGTAVTFTATVKNADPNPVYQWIKNSLPVGTNSNTYTDNTLTSTDTVSCKLTNTPGAASNTIQLTVNNTPIPDLSTFTTVCNNDSLSISPGSFDTYLWQDGSTGNSYTVKSAGLYSVTVTNNCGSGHTQTTIAETECSISFPNAFTPDGNGLNDVFRLKDPPPLIHFRLAVYNRYGQLVFETSDPTQGWDGSYKGKQAVTGNYIWTCEFNKPGNKVVFKQRGSLLLLR